MVVEKKKWSFKDKLLDLTPNCKKQLDLSLSSSVHTSRRNVKENPKAELWGFPFYLKILNNKKRKPMASFSLYI